MKKKLLFLDILEFNYKFQIRTRLMLLQQIQIEKKNLSSCNEKFEQSYFGF